MIQWRCPYCESFETQFQDEAFEHELRCPRRRTVLEQSQHLYDLVNTWPGPTRCENQARDGVI